ncbi:MAG: DinB family protein [Acidobacteriota bacterium]|nr:DinB family protein [Acidobacteriota bacterium]
MPLIDVLLPEFDREMGQTRKVLDRVPDQFDWRPHPTSMTLGRLAEHLTEMPLWATTTMALSELDMTTPRPADYKSPATRAEVLAMFDAHLKTARANLVNKTDGEFDAPWKLKAGGQEVFTMPKASVLRAFVLNHMVHHRGQMTVYLRMLGVKIPSLYGPSGDERPPM